MLDVFSHVFGRKSSKSGTPSQQSQDQEGFEIVGETGSDRTSISSNQSFVNDPAPPYQGATPLNKPMPYGLAPPSYNISHTAFTSPLENVPFTLHPNLRVAEEMKKSWINVSMCLSAIDRYKNLEQETYYSFELENTVLNEMSQAQI